MNFHIAGQPKQSKNNHEIACFFARLFLETPPHPRPLSRLPVASKTGLPVGLAAGAITGVLKSKNRLAFWLLGFTSAVFENYLKKFSRMHIISHLLWENQGRLWMQ
jgi:hypothetical protein